MAEGKPFKQLLNTAEKAFKKLHANGSYDPKKLLEVKEYKALIDATATIFNGALSDNDIPAEMLQSLQNDVFVFSGLKTNAQLLEASKQLLTDDGKIKSFNTFSNDIKSISKDYNQNYLEAEYEFAVTSSQMAGKWAAISDDYNLQYRTAGDDHVRASHAALDAITLPADDAFWLSYYPPNGWRCRCNAIEVRKSRYEVTDSGKAMAAGEAATNQLDKAGNNKLAIFRFNPGAKQVVFPPEHPYGKVKGAGVVKEVLKSKFVPENIDDIENRFDIKVDREIFKHLNREIKLTNDNKKVTAWSALSFAVNIGDDQKERGKWATRAVFHHEFGHAVDYQNKLAYKPEVRNLMDKYREKYAEKKNLGFKSFDIAVKQITEKARKEKDYDTVFQALSAADSLMALNNKYGFGHTRKYMSEGKKSENEFLAHCFENKYDTNPVLKQIAPDLYDDMINILDEILP